MNNEPNAKIRPKVREKIAQISTNVIQLLDTKAYTQSCGRSDEDIEELR